MPKPASILFTIPNFITAGSGQALANIILRLDRSQIAPSVCVSRRGGKLEAVLQAAGVPILEQNTTIAPKPYFSLLQRAHAAADFFKPYHFDLWHSFHYSDDYTEPLIAHFSGARAWIFTKKNMSWNRRSWWMRSLFATRILAQNTDMLRLFFAGWLFRAKTSLVQRGVDLERFQPQPPNGSLRAHFGISQNAPLIGIVAQLVPVKDHPTLIEAVSRLSTAHLFLAGSTTDDNYRASLENLCARFGISSRAHFLGAVTDIPGFLSDVDIFAFTSRMEGCPVALIEAMACGKACIATNIPGSRDLIIPNENGLLVPPEDPAALAEALQLLINSPELRLALGRSARARVEQHFSIEREVKAHAALYHEILSR